MRSRRVNELFEVIHEDEELLAVNKPPDLVCHPTKTDEYSSLIGRLRLYLGSAAHPQLVNRLDRETSGVTIVAKTADSARTLRRLWEDRQVRKNYLALVHGHPVAERRCINAPLGRDTSSKVAIKDCVRSDGSPAQTEYHVLRRFKYKVKSTGEIKLVALLNVHPLTGRKHQIRIHLASVGHPIVGDKLYGEDEDLYLALVERRLTEEHRARLILTNHALHAYQVTFLWKAQQQTFEARSPEWVHWGDAQ